MIHCNIHSLRPTFGSFSNRSPITREPNSPAKYEYRVNRKFNTHKNTPVCETMGLKIRAQQFLLDGYACRIKNAPKCIEIFYYYCGILISQQFFTLHVKLTLILHISLCLWIYVFVDQIILNFYIVWVCRNGIVSIVLIHTLMYMRITYRVL